MIKRLLLVFATVQLFYGCAIIQSEKKVLNNDPLEEQGDKSTSSNSTKELIDLDVEKRVLDNGLTVLLVKNSYLPIFSFYTYFKIGARFESKGMTGATHFLEHLMFKGSKKYGVGEFDKIIEGNGGSSNAYTTMDLTVYHESIPSGALDKIIDIESDRMGNLLLSEDAFEKERKVILEERKFRYENSPGGQLFLAMTQAMFAHTPYGGSVIGDIEDLKNVSRDQIRKYFKKFYSPNNAVVVIVGDIDIEKTLNIIKDKYGKIPPDEEIKNLKEQKNQYQLYKFKPLVRKKIYLHGNSPTPMFRISYPGYEITHRKTHAFDILASLLGEGDSSYLHQLFVENTKAELANVYANHLSYERSGIFFIGGSLLKGTSLKGFYKKFKKERQHICERAVTDRSVEKTKNKIFVDYFSNLKTNSGMAEMLGNYEVFYGDYNFYQEDLKLYEQMSTEEVRTVCHEVFNDPQSELFISVWDKNPKNKNI